MQTNNITESSASSQHSDLRRLRRGRHREVSRGFSELFVVFGSMFLAKFFFRTLIIECKSSYTFVKKRNLQCCTRSLSKSSFCFHNDDAVILRHFADDCSDHSSTMDHQSELCKAAQTALEAPSDRSLRVACYCEENVWRLAHRRMQNNTTTSTYYVVFVSNERQCVAMWHQMAREGGPCFWDYHVILLETTPDHKTLVLDMDTQLSYPCPFNEYLKDTFLQVMGQYAPLFRYVFVTIM